MVILLIEIGILIVMANPVTPEKKGKRRTTFKDSYKKDFPCIRESRKGPTHAFCTECRSDFSLAAGGSNDIRNHIQSMCDGHLPQQCRLRMCVFYGK